MKRSFAYLVLALLLSLLLSACADTTERGNVTASPWPDVTAPVMPTPVMPSPTADFSVSPTPELGTGNENEPGTGNDADSFGNNPNGMITSTPAPTDYTR